MYNILHSVLYTVLLLATTTHAAVTKFLFFFLFTLFQYLVLRTENEKRKKKLVRPPSPKCWASSKYLWLFYIYNIITHMHICIIHMQFLFVRYIRVRVHHTPMYMWAGVRDTRVKRNHWWRCTFKYVYFRYMFVSFYSHEYDDDDDDDDGSQRWKQVRETKRGPQFET